MSIVRPFLPWLCLCGLVASPLPADDGFQPAYATHFATGLDKKLQIQEPKADCIQVVDAPAGREGKALQVTIDQADDYSKVANGVPRAEVSFGQVTIDAKP